MTGWDGTWARRIAYGVMFAGVQWAFVIGWEQRRRIGLGFFSGHPPILVEMLLYIRYGLGDG